MTLPKIPADRWAGGAASEVDRRVRQHVARYHTSWTAAHVKVLAADEELRQAYVADRDRLPPPTYEPNKLQLVAVGLVLGPETVRPNVRKERDPDELRGRNMRGRRAHNRKAS